MLQCGLKMLLHVRSIVEVLLFHMFVSIIVYKIAVNTDDFLPLASGTFAYTLQERMAPHTVMRVMHQQGVTLLYIPASVQVLYLYL